MKKLLFGAIALFLMASCGRKEVVEKTSEGSTRIADSLAHVEAIKEAEEAVKLADAAIARARLDSLRQDSIAKADAFYKKLPDPKKIIGNPKAGSYLKNLGFSGTSHGDVESEEEDEVVEGTYILTEGNKTCKIHFTTEFHFADTEVTITGDDDALTKFYKKASKLRASYEEGGSSVEKKGKTVYISAWGA